MHVPVPAKNPRGLAVCLCAALTLAGAGAVTLGGLAQASTSSAMRGVLPYPGTPDASPQMVSAALTNTNLIYDDLLLQR